MGLIVQRHLEWTVLGILSLNVLISIILVLRNVPVIQDHELSLLYDMGALVIRFFDIYNLEVLITCSRDTGCSFDSINLM